jgi:adenylylsulfate kinase-like enzyme
MRFLFRTIFKEWNKSAEVSSVAKNDTKGSLVARLSNLQSIRNVAKKYEHEEQFMKFYVLYIHM